MARITVEDCEKVVGNRFELVILAVQRARQMLEGDKPTIDDSDDEKKSVVALREIAARTVSVEDLREKAINGFRSFMPAEDEEEDPEDLTEEDTYNPYEGISKQALEKETARFTHETEESAKDSNLR